MLLQRLSSVLFIVGLGCCSWCGTCSAACVCPDAVVVNECTAVSARCSSEAAIDRYCHVLLLSSLRPSLYFRISDCIVIAEMYMVP